MDDHIRRADAIKAFHDALDGGYVIQNDAQSARIINEIHAADVRPVVKGEWVKNKDRVGWHCSVCNEDNNFAYSWNSEKGKNEFQDNYCPCCGAKMGGTDGRQE